MLGQLASKLRTAPIHSLVINYCNSLAFEQPLIAQLSSINNWKHTYVGWIVVG